MAEEKKYKTGKAKKTLSVDVLKYVSKYYIEANRAKKKGSKPICYHTSLDPIEIDYAMGIIPMLPENFAAICGALQIAPDLIEVAEQRGCPSDLCSYFKNHFGYMEGGKDLPSMKDAFDMNLIVLPDPDMVCSLRNICRLHPIWMRQVARFYNVPAFTMDAPQLHPKTSLSKIDDHYIEFGVSQLKDYISFLEKHTGRKFDMERLSETVALSDRLSKIFEEIYELRKVTPCPVGGEDLNSLVFFLVTEAGSQEAVDVAQGILDEVKDKVRRREGALPEGTEEAHRVSFVGIPPWHDMATAFTYMQKYGATSVDEIYVRAFSGFAGRMDPSHPLESLVRKYFFIYPTTTEQALRLINIEDIASYGIDGFVCWNLTTCRLISTLIARLKAMYDLFNIPYVTCDADQVDPRQYNVEQVRNRLDAFFENLEE